MKSSSDDIRVYDIHIMVGTLLLYLSYIKGISAYRTQDLSQKISASLYQKSRVGV